MDKDFSGNRNIVNRLARIEGHVRSVKAMVAAGGDCAEILTQLSAVHQAVENTTKAFLKNHMEVCVAKAIQEGKKEEALAELQIAIDRFMR
ncbi:MAG: metal-sensing transcriptional repressor [Acholeplasmataceae bacterium]|jgi:DNA-binding FrmR family transcriptional regulator|nr:metal-sensing transcriptional repressor [Acidaminococcaceae bacterium]NLY84573.1 metal-sensing transcriptional repressor [Acholeplasmataceae bacterium]